MWQRLAGGLLGIMVVPVFLIVGGILLNRPMLFQPPGTVARLMIYFRYHVAETGVSPRLPELRIRHYRVSKEAIQAAIEKAFLDLDRWRIVEAEPAVGFYRVVVTTPLWRFKDDVSVLVTESEGKVEVYLHSSSRTGRGDLGANRLHIVKFYEILEKHLNNQSIS
jgi:uncharacterized protein (DUF1499 family)